MLHPIAQKAIKTFHAMDKNVPVVLIRHLETVQSTAEILCKELHKAWPNLLLDYESVVIGASVHDLGKVDYPEELIKEGNQHVLNGPDILFSAGVPEHYVHFARTHEQWECEPLEDQLVALADTIWKGGRYEKLEGSIIRLLVEKINGYRVPESVLLDDVSGTWEIFMVLDKIIENIANDGQARIEHQRSGHLDK